MVSRRFLIAGRVQGVGFRQHVFRAAVYHGLAGEVWNRRDGAVECVAFGSEDALLLLEEAIRRGPGYVESVQVLPAEVCEREDFIIGATR